MLAELLIEHDLEQRRSPADKCRSAKAAASGEHVFERVARERSAWQWNPRATIVEIKRAEDQGDARFGTQRPDSLLQMFIEPFIIRIEKRDERALCRAEPGIASRSATTGSNRYSTPS